MVSSFAENLCAGEDIIARPTAQNLQTKSEVQVSMKFFQHVHA